MLSGRVIICINRFYDSLLWNWGTFNVEGSNILALELMRRRECDLGYEFEILYKRSEGSFGILNGM